jgi:hypothetical protein
MTMATIILTVEFSAGNNGIWSIDRFDMLSDGRGWVTVKHPGNSERQGAFDLDRFVITLPHIPPLPGSSSSQAVDVKPSPENKGMPDG